MGAICPKCESSDLTHERSSGYDGLRCSDCGQWTITSVCIQASNVKDKREFNVKKRNVFKMAKGIIRLAPSRTYPLIGKAQCIFCEEIADTTSFEDIKHDRKCEYVIAKELLAKFE